MFHDAHVGGGEYGAARSAPDIVSSSDVYARRFSGPVGGWLLEVQSNAIDNMITPWPEGDILDVGGGHAQITPHLLDSARDVTTVVSSEHCGARLRRLTGGRARCVTDDVEVLSLPDRSVDIAIAVRMTAHVSDWRTFLGSLCRVARQAVIVDFPLAGGANALSPLLFGAKKAIEGDTRVYRSLRKSDVEAAFADHGFAADAHIGQFVVPMAAHRFLQNVRVSKLAESMLKPLAGRLGNPVMIRARRL